MGLKEWLGRAMVPFCVCMFMVVLVFLRVSLSVLYAWKLLLDQAGQVHLLPCGLLVSAGDRDGKEMRLGRVG